MPELSTETLPLLPLTSGVVLPGMVVTATLETPESRSASSAAGDTGGHLLLVPKVDGRYATVGTVAKIENAGELPNGQLAVVVGQGDGMQVDHRVQRLEVVLHLHPLPKRPDVVAEVGGAGGLDAGEDAGHGPVPCCSRVAR